MSLEPGRCSNSDSQAQVTSETQPRTVRFQQVLRAKATRSKGSRPRVTPGSITKQPASHVRHAAPRAGSWRLGPPVL